MPQRKLRSQGAHPMTAVFQYISSAISSLIIFTHTGSSKSIKHIAVKSISLVKTPFLPFLNFMRANDSQRLSSSVVTLNLDFKCFSCHRRSEGAFVNFSTIQSSFSFLTVRYPLSVRMLSVLYHQYLRL